MILHVDFPPEEGDPRIANMSARARELIRLHQDLTGYSIVELFFVHMPKQGPRAASGRSTPPPISRGVPERLPGAHASSARGVLLPASGFETTFTLSNRARDASATDWLPGRR